ncbi:MAG TPA: ABC transporter ATP-binding protein, partial [Candidatus Methylomirabilis sp.]|nr:ABC transporter ATP-binding protein [Candidatus Methylomirabilis sp.]
MGAGSPVDLELLDVSLSYGNVAAVRGVSLAVRRGEFLALLGPSGCGKTTTLRMIAGLVDPGAGRILVRGKNLVGVPTYHRNVGMVFQNYALFPHRTVAENIAFGLVMRRQPRKEIEATVERMLTLVRLPALGHRYPRQLSGGQQQRVALARALAIEPSLLLLDEPLSNLDLKLREEMRLELRAIQSLLGITTVFVTHDQEEALVMADRIAVMRAGRLEQVGTTEQVYHDPANQFVAGFLGESNFIRARVERLEPGGVVVARGPAGTELRGRAREPLPVGETVMLAVRPERMRIAMAGASRANQARGRVAEIIFKGSSLRFHVWLAEDCRCAVAQQNSNDQQIVGRGQAVIVEWATEDCL